VTLGLSLLVTLFMDQISQVWELLLTLGAGTGLVYILRWYWWRVNAWSEVSAMGCALLASVCLRVLGHHVPMLDTQTATGFALNLIATTALTTAVWLGVTLLTPPEPAETLRAFYMRVRPAGPGWAPVAATTSVRPVPGELRRNAAFWVLGTVFVYSIMFGTGGVLFGQTRQALTFAILGVVSGALLLRGMAREPSNVADASAVQ